MAKQRIKISNDSSSFATLWLEPWGEDYGMLPGDELEVAAMDVEKETFFYVAYNEKGMQVFAEGDAKYVSVYQNGERLSCGHNRREEAW